MIKKLIGLSVIFFFVVQPILAQPTLTLEAFGGWLWTGSAGNNGSIKVDDKGNYGIRVGVSPMSEILVEFEWNHTDTRLQWNDFLSPTDFEEDVTFDYYMIGINKQMSEGPAIPYGLLNLGVLNVRGQTINFSENWFVVGLGGGIKYYLSDKIGIRLQARIILPMQFAGIGIGCGSGGCGGGISGYASTIQGDFTGGVILKMGG